MTSCENRGVHVVVIRGSMLGRLLAVLVLVVGIIGMHHVVATGCAFVTGSHSSTHGQELVSSNSLAEAVTDVASAEPVDVAGTVCVAIIVLWILAAPLRRRLFAVRDSVGEAAPAESFAPLARPPDLHLLSISRT